ncbi:TetR/AcrR family transcriptional regulator [Iamia sp. SCSIO 61187]|uniref:TetR/AcrR family transcriptional regulator n=1 Tax=Iamia sp. SCSIO 61187 TaxID=2722752 RepID=UPI001C628DE9|nr:TetR/AcrR family transcriptional regulator [Iamia sp. SCSIO 61187]QYG95131.1 TetR/AcrR family transcriptional regulator [Iamia sp. SCSIO 61187]
MAPAESSDGDGRTARRARNREAVVTALLDLYRDGVLMPSADQIAARAGVSARSIFRYFADVDDLASEAVARQQEHLAPLLVLDLDPDAPLDDRIAAFVSARVRVLSGMGEVGRVARIRSVQQPVVARGLAHIRRALRDQVSVVLGPGLADRPDAERAALLAAADVLCSWEAHDLMRHDQGLGPDATEAAMGLALRRLLAPAPAPVEDRR